MLPRLTIVIPCYNDGRFLPDAVQSVAALQRTDVELIVVDDGSTDPATLALLARQEAGGTRVLRQANSGLARARNAGIAAAGAPVILPLDADNRITPGYVEQGLAVLEARPRVGVVYSDAEYFGEKTGRWTVGPFQPARLLKWNYIDACALFRKTVWEQHGGYDPDMPVQGLEDWDFWLGAHARGWEFAYLPEPLFAYRVRSDSMIHQTGPEQKAVTEYVARKHGVLYRQAWEELSGYVHLLDRFPLRQLANLRRKWRTP